MDSTNKANGKLYIDDGESFDYLTDENASAYIQFSFEDGILSSSFISGKYYDFPPTQVVTKINVFGLKSEQLQVLVDSEEKIIHFGAKSISVEGISLQLGKGAMLRIKSF